MREMGTFFECKTEEIVQGTIDKVIEPGRKWRVKVYGVYWRASAFNPTSFSLGERVQVVERKNNTLLIAPI